MKFFSDFPRFDTFYANDKKYSMIDISVRIKFFEYIEKYKDNLTILDYLIENDKRPEEVSYELYGTYDYVWMILLLNKIYSIYDEWPISNDVVEAQLIQKYGSLENSNQTYVHYYSEFGHEVSADSWAILNAAYAQRTNNFMILKQTDGEQTVNERTNLGFSVTRRASQVHKGQLIERQKPTKETAYQKAIRENEEKKNIKVFSSKVAFRIYSELSSMFEL